MTRRPIPLQRLSSKTRALHVGNRCPITVIYILGVHVDEIAIQVLQSIICKPAHEERLELPDEDALEGTYTVQGFAFNGGGYRIERVELSLDGGKTWRWCFRHFVDSPLRCASKLRSIRGTH